MVSHPSRFVAAQRSTLFTPSPLLGKGRFGARPSTLALPHRFNELLLVIVTLLLILSALPAHARNLWVDHDSRGGGCSDAVSADMNAAGNGSRPWCTLGAAGKNVRAGDVVLVRGGTYSEQMTCNGTPGCSAFCVLELIKKGTKAAPIIYQAFPGETVTISPAGKRPQQNWPFGLVYGLCAGHTEPVGLCKSGSRVGQDCQSASDCGGATCDKSPDFQTIVSGFTFTDWSFYDARMTATNNAHIPSQYAVHLNWALGPMTNVTVQNSIFRRNHGGGAFFALGTAAITFQNNLVEDNHTHGWTSPVNFWRSVGKREGVNVIRNNMITNNHDDPPPFCLPKVCTGEPAQGSACTWDQWINTTPIGPQHGGCGCDDGSDCASGVCQARDCSAATGGCECAGTTEGHGIILDSAQGLCENNQSIKCGWDGDPACNGGKCLIGEAGGFLIERNVITNNDGTCISVFRSSGATIRNNTCVTNMAQRRNTGEIVAFTNNTTITGNVVIARPTRACWLGPKSGTDCTDDPNVCGTSPCMDTYAIALYENSFTFPIRPATNVMDYNVVWSSRPNQKLLQWGSGQYGTVSDALKAGRAAGSKQIDPKLFLGTYAPTMDSPVVGAARSGLTAGAMNAVR